MTEVHQYWTSPKEPALVVVEALGEAAGLAEEQAAVEAEAAAVVAVLEAADLQAWEDCSRLECPS